VAPIFRHETLLSFVPIFARMAERQVERWRAAKPGAPVDAAAAMTRTTFDIIVDAMLDGSASLDAESFGRALTDSFNTIPWQIIYVMFSLPEWLPYPNRRRALRARDFLWRDLLRIVQTRRAKLSPNPDLLGLLLAARDPETGRTMTDAGVVNNLLTFIIAGHETTAVALSWTLWLLAKDQANQERTFEEAKAVAGDGPITGCAHRGPVLLPPSDPGSDAAVPAGTRHRAAGARRDGTRRDTDCGRRARSHSGIRSASQRAALGQSQCLRSGMLHRRPGQGALALRFFAVWRRPAHLHRGRIRHHRGRGGPRDFSPQLPLCAGCRP
jgi:predicted small lipoprotein YifL